MTGELVPLALVTVTDKLPGPALGASALICSGQLRQIPVFSAGMSHFFRRLARVTQ